MLFQLCCNMMKRIIPVLFLHLLLTLAIGCDRSNTSFPAELKGRWITDAPRYEDRFLEISSWELTFGTGENLPQVLFVNKVGKIEKGKGVEWTLNCQNNTGDSIDIVLFYEAELEGAQIFLKNKEHILWTRDQE